MAKSRIYESAILLLVALTLFRPGLWMDMISPPHKEVAPTELLSVADTMQAGDELRIKMLGEDDIGEAREFVALLNLGEGSTGAERIEAAGLELLTKDDKVIVDGTGFDSAAAKAGFEFDQVIQSVLKPNAQPTKYLMFIPALLALFGIGALQRRRREA